MNRYGFFKTLLSVFVPSVRPRPGTVYNVPSGATLLIPEGAEIGTLNLIGGTVAHTPTSTAILSLEKAAPIQ